jgi:predicted  nucleic acid-binding Zn-ribbon protein
VLIMNKETQLKVLNLELTKQELLIKNLSKKIQRLEKANERVYNAISQEEIDDLKLELETLEIQKKIIQSKIRDVS